MTVTVTVTKTKDAVIHTGDTDGMIHLTPAICAAVAAYWGAVERRQNINIAYEATRMAHEAMPTGRGSGKLRAAFHACDVAADDAVTATRAAHGDVERAVRAANPGRAELDINTMVRELLV